MCLCKGTCSVNVHNINFSWKRLLCWDRVPSLLFLGCPWCHHWGLTLWLHQVLIVSLRPQPQVLLSYGSDGYDSNAKAVGEHIQIIENFKILPWTQTIGPSQPITEETGTHRESMLYQPKIPVMERSRAHSRAWRTAFRGGWVFWHIPSLGRDYTHLLYLCSNVCQKAREWQPGFLGFTLQLHSVSLPIKWLASLLPPPPQTPRAVMKLKRN